MPCAASRPIPTVSRRRARCILLQVLIGAVDCPGGFRFEPPYPKPVEAHPTPHGKAEHFGSNKPLSGPHLGFPRGPEDLLIDAEGRPNRIDKAFSWDAPLVGPWR